jgi:hypothetical protein
MVDQAVAHQVVTPRFLVEMEIHLLHPQAKETMVEVVVPTVLLETVAVAVALVLLAGTGLEAQEEPEVMVEMEQHHQ